MITKSNTFEMSGQILGFGVQERKGGGGLQKNVTVMSTVACLNEGQ